MPFSAAAQTVLAKIGNQNLTVNDLDPQIKIVTERLAVEIADLRKRELEKEINRLLIAAEAAAGNTTADKLLDSEVRAKIPNPSETQLQEIYNANREALGNVTFEEAKPRIANYLRREQENQLTTALAEKLKQKYKVVPGIDVNSPNLKSTDVLATVAGKTILAANFNERLKPHEYDLQHAVYEATKNSLDNAIYTNLIVAEAARRNVQPEDVIRQEITEKLKEPSEAEARKFYEERKSQIEVDFETAKNQILSYLAEQERSRLQTALRDRLAAQSKVQILLREPETPILKVSADDDPAKGNTNAPVTVVMFSDFQCPACARTHPVLEAVLKQYLPAKVRFIVRDFPLTDLHPQAFRAAEAANAAHTQGKYFEYIEILYKNQKSLDDASLKKYAAQIGLNARRFAADLTSGRFAAEIRKDREDGENYGIKGTPTVYVNGVAVVELSEDNFKKAIEKALSKK